MTRAAPTKAEAPFTSGPLKGLWHKHWFQVDFLAANLLKESARHGEKLIRKHLNSVFGRDRWIGEIMTEELASQLAHTMVDGALSHRAGTRARKKSRLTGEWIVFAKSNGRNVYLTLGGHGETNKAILDRCLLALREFPELALLAPFAKDDPTL